MKLYATVTSERASKGQGGNKRLDVQFTAGVMQESMGVVSLREREANVFVLVYTHNGEQKNIATIETKGEKQKGERGQVCHHCKAITKTSLQYWYCANCGTDN
ncbi:MAG: hypothetical protein V4436_02070 [Patescibacteria group bacterium]